MTEYSLAGLIGIANAEAAYCDERGMIVKAAEWRAIKERLEQQQRLEAEIAGLRMEVAPHV